MIPKVPTTTTTFMAGVSLGQKPTAPFTTSRLPPPELRTKFPFSAVKNVVLVHNYLY